MFSRRRMWSPDRSPEGIPLFSQDSILPLFKPSLAQLVEPFHLAGRAGADRQPHRPVLQAPTVTITTRPRPLHRPVDAARFNLHSSRSLRPEPPGLPQLGIGTPGCSKSSPPPSDRLQLTAHHDRDNPLGGSVPDTDHFGRGSRSRKSVVNGSVPRHLCRLALAASRPLTLTIRSRSGWQVGVG